MPFARVEVADSHGASCGIGLTVCPATLTWGESAGETDVDARAHVERATVALDFREPRALLGRLWVLPDQSVSVDGSRLYVVHPPVPYRAVGAAVPLSEGDPVWLAPDDFGYDVHCPGIQDAVPGDVLCFQDGSWRFRVGMEADSQFVGLKRDRVTFYNASVPVRSSDYYLDLTRSYLCTYGGSCDETTSAPFAMLNASLPNAHVSARIERAEVATDPDILLSSAGAHLRASTAPPERHAVPAAAARLTPLDDGPAALAVEAMPEAPPAGPRGGDAGPPGAAGSVTTSAITAGPPDGAVSWTLVATGAFASLLLVAAAVALYSRFSNREEAMRSATRHRVLAALHAEPGLTPTDLAKRLGMTRNAVTHHVKILVEKGLAHAERRNRRVFVFPRGTEHLMEDMVLARLCAEDPLVDLLARHPGLTRAEIHRCLPDLPQRTRNHKIRRLLELGAIRRERRDGAERYFLSGA